MKEAIIKLIDSGNKEDIIIGMHLLGQYSWEEILKFFQNNFKLYAENRYFYERCSVVINFAYEENVIYIGGSIITVSPPWKQSKNIDKIIIR